MSFQQACQSKFDFGISRYKTRRKKRIGQFAESIRETGSQEALLAAKNSAD